MNAKQQDLILCLRHQGRKGEEQMKSIMIKVVRKIDERFAYFTNLGELRQSHLKAEGKVRDGKQPGYNYVQLYMRNGNKVDTLDCPTPEQLRAAATLLLNGHVKDMGGAREQLRWMLKALKGDPQAQLLASQL